MPNNSHHCHILKAPLLSFRPPPTLTTNSLKDRQVAVSIMLSSTAMLLLLMVVPYSVLRANEEEYVSATVEVITKMRNTINMDKGDPNVVSTVEELREASDNWVAEYRREKKLFRRPSFRDRYSVLNIIFGHYISFVQMTQISTKCKARILQEIDSAEKALQ